MMTIKLSFPFLAVVCATACNDPKPTESSGPASPEIDPTLVPHLDIPTAHYTPLDDASLNQRAGEALGDDARFAYLDVFVVDGKAAIRGTVERLAHARAARRRLGELRGLRATHDLTEVAPKKRWEKQKLVKHLEVDLKDVEGTDDVDVDYSLGTLNLTGTVPSRRVEVAVLDAARNIEGISKVVDHVRIESVAPRADLAIRGDIVEALEKEPQLADYTHVSVVVEDGEAFISGEVFDLRRYYEVLEHAYVDGVHLVHPHGLFVDPSAFSVPESGS